MNKSDYNHLCTFVTFHLIWDLTTLIFALPPPLNLSGHRRQRYTQLLPEMSAWVLGALTLSFSQAEYRKRDGHSIQERLETHRLQYGTDPNRCELSMKLTTNTEVM